MHFAAAPAFLLLSFLSHYFCYFSIVNWWVDVSYWWIIFLLSTSSFSQACQTELLFHDALSYPTPLLSFLISLCVYMSLTEHSSVGYSSFINSVCVTSPNRNKFSTLGPLILSNTLAKYEVDWMDSLGGL